MVLRTARHTTQIFSGASHPKHARLVSETRLMRCAGQTGESL